MQTPVGMAAEPDTYRGPEGIRRWFESFYEVMEEIRLEQKAVQAWLIRDGLARRIEFFTDLDEALAALGGEGS